MTETIVVEKDKNKNGKSTPKIEKERKQQKCEEIIKQKRNKVNYKLC